MTWNSGARQALSHEQGTIIKDWGGRIPIALIYPNNYYVGMSSLGLQTIYGLFNSYDAIVCERVFCNSGGKSIESGRPLADFAVFAFSVSSELDYFNVLDMLITARVPLHAAKRSDSHPIVIAGGPCVTTNPEPLVPFFDGFAIGEGEAIVPSMVTAFEECIQMGRDELLHRLSSIPGMYVPLIRDNDIVERQMVHNLDDFETASVILTPHTEFSNMYLLEISRGCRWGCRFCLAGFAFRPMRFRSTEKLLRTAKKGLTCGKRIGLLSASPADHPQIDEMVVKLRHMGAEISASSLRIRPLSTVLLHGIAESDSTTVTFAPEAGSERLRQVINKGITERDIITAADEVGALNFHQMKLYFMIGLPTETAEDIDDMIRLVLALKERLVQQRAGTRIVLSFEPFVPKAGTPFQRLPMASQKMLKHNLSRLRSSLEPRGIELRAESVPWAAVQGTLSRGDRRLAEALVRAVARYREGDGESVSLPSWRLALAELGIDADRYINRQIPPNERLPWEHIRSGVDASYLEKELERGLLGEESPPCPSIECHRCGVC